MEIPNEQRRATAKKDEFGTNATQEAIKRKDDDPQSKLRFNETDSNIKIWMLVLTTKLSLALELAKQSERKLSKRTWTVSVMFWLPLHMSSKLMRNSDLVNFRTQAEQLSELVRYTNSLSQPAKQPKTRKRGHKKTECGLTIELRKQKMISNLSHQSISMFPEPYKTIPTSTANDTTGIRRCINGQTPSASVRTRRRKPTASKNKKRKRSDVTDCDISNAACPPHFEPSLPSSAP